MKKLFVVGLLMLLLIPVLAMAQNPFDGTWKFDPSTLQFPTKPDVYLLQNGVYECKTCVPQINVKADGTDQKVTGDPYSDTLMVKVIDDHNNESTSKKGGKVVGTAKMSVSSDGKTLTVNWTDSGEPSGGTQTGTYTEERVDKVPASGNLVSGSWHPEKANASAAALTWTFKVNGDELTMTNLTGQSYTAKLDGTEAPFKGDPGVTSVSVKMRGKDTLEETRKRDGKVIAIFSNTVSADGKTLKIVAEDKLQGTTAKGEAQKQ
jgi:hypothetical protein